MYNICRSAILKFDIILGKSLSEVEIDYHLALVAVAFAFQVKLFFFFLLLLFEQKTNSIKSSKKTIYFEQDVCVTLRQTPSENFIPRIYFPPNNYYFIKLQNQLARLFADSYQNAPHY